MSPVRAFSVLNAALLLCNQLLSDVVGFASDCYPWLLQKPYIQPAVTSSGWGLHALSSSEIVTQFFFCPEGATCAVPLCAWFQGSLCWKISCCVFCALLCIFLVDALVGWVASSSQKALIKIQAGSTSKCERLTKLCYGRRFGVDKSQVICCNWVMFCGGGSVPYSPALPYLNI